MKKYIAIFILLFLGAKTSIGQTHPNSDLLEKSVVVVIALDDNRNIIAWGSGVIIDSRGTIITNYHVLEDGYYIKIRTEQGDEFDMDKIIAENSNCDLIKFTIKNPHNVVFTPVKISKTKPKKAEDVWAMGTPDDIKNINQISHGGITNIFAIQDFKILQTDAKIAHGSSGGGLFNSLGELIGITGGKFKGEDATLAGRNIAIAVGAFSKLYSVNKDRLESAIPKTSNTYVPPKYQTPDPPKNEYRPQERGKVSFYTDWNNQSIRISIDGDVRSFPNYFTSGSPVCGQDGTVNYELPPGTYSWRAIGVYDIQSLREYTWSGTVTITANDCKLVFVPKPYDANNASEYSTKRHSDNKVPVRSWMLGVGTSGGTAFYLDKYFRNGKYNLQLSFDGFVYGNSDQNSLSTGYSFNYSWNKYGIGYYRVFSTNEGYIDFALRTGPSIRYLSGSYSGDFSNGKISDVFINWRAGLDVLIANRILIRGEGGYGYATQGWIVSQSVYPVVSYSSDLLNPKFTYDYDLLIGYKFGKLKKRYKSANPVVKHIPELLLPGETDLHIAANSLLPKTKKSYAKKGRIKMGLFLASTATAIGSSIYSNSEYSRYTNGDPNSNMTHYNNANLAHKIALTSSAVVVGLYLNDIVHFCAKIKTIKNQ